MEDLVSASSSTSSAVSPSPPPIVTKHRRTLTSSQRVQLLQRETWRDVLGPPPSMGTSKVLPPSVSSLCTYHTPFQGRNLQMYFTFVVWYKFATNIKKTLLNFSFLLGRSSGVGFIPQEEMETSNGPQTGEETVATTTGKGRGHQGRCTRRDVVARPCRVSTATEPGPN